VREPVTRLVSDFTQITFNRVERGMPIKTFDESIGKFSCGVFQALPIYVL
jgi:hypothetical protein